MAGTDVPERCAVGRCYRPALVRRENRAGCDHGPSRQFRAGSDPDEPTD